NTMTKELERQRTDLVTANTQLTERSRFMEAVLSGVSAGVIGLDRDERINLASRSAQKLLGLEGTDLVGRQLTEAVPQFTAFARMPKPQMEDHDIRDVVRASVLDRQMGNGDIAFDKRLGDEPVLVSCDRRLMAQAIHNLVKNAEEAIQQYAESPDKEAGWRGRIETVVRRNGNRVEIEVIDNGPGLPKQNRMR